MKKLFFAILAMVAVAVSCGKKNESNVNDNPQNNVDSYNVSLALKGDISISETPLSRADASNDLYGINVYYNKNKDINYVIYGYGLFDNVPSMTISLLTGYKYKFECTLVKDGKTKIYNGNDYYSYFLNPGYSTAKVSTAGYSLPFRNYSSTSYPYGYSNTPLANSFVLGSSNYFTFIKNGWSAMANLGGMTQANYSNPTTGINFSSSFVGNNGSPQMYPATDRYYGELLDYIPSQNGVATIDMKRTVFGARFEVLGITDGTFNISSDFINKDFAASSNEYEDIYTFNDVAGCWSNADTYSKEFTFTLTWKRGNNVTQTLDPQKVTFKRNILTTVSINLNGASNDASLGLNEESTPMGAENVDISINAGDPTDNIVNP